MIVNPSAFKKLGNIYECNNRIMEYLSITCRIFPIGYSGKRYFFRRDKELDNCLHKMPFNLKISSFLKK